MNNRLLTVFSIAVLAGMNISQRVAAQQKQPKDSLNPKFTIDIQGYDPVLAESSKISSETPAKDTSAATPPKLDYSIQTKPFDSKYEAATITSVKIKDPKLPKLYHGLAKAGLGNNGTYLGELFLNSTRSKKTQTGIHLLHFSGDPSLKDVGYGGFSDNKADLYGKLFLDHSIFTGSMGYTRKVVHYYGFNSNDTIIPHDDTKQLFNAFDLGLDYKSDYLNRNHLDHHFSINYYNLNDHFETAENDVAVNGTIGKNLSGNYASLHFLFDYMKKTDGKNQLLTFNSNPSRNIFTLEPKINLDKDKMKLTAGLNFTREYNYDAAYHLFPEVHLGLPIAENILSIFADVNGYVQKNTYRSFLEDNPFINNTLSTLVNTTHKIIFKGGVTGNFSAATSFEAHFAYDAFEHMPLYVNINNTFTSQNKFDLTYDDGSLMNIHAEFHHHPNDKFLFGLKADYYSYTMDIQKKAWQKPVSELTLSAGYNIADQILASLEIYSNGNRNAYSRELGTIDLKGYVDVSLKLEYRYSKILSVFLELNNLGFSRYYRWNNYPSERLNALGGLTYAFWGDKTK